MFLSAERLAIANQTVLQTFEDTSIAWQAIPHWDTGDPGQSRVRDDVVNNPSFLNLDLEHYDFQVTLVQTSAPTPDSLLAEVMAAATELARLVDVNVLTTLRAAAVSNAKLVFDDLTTAKLLDSLIDARVKVEDAGYRAPSCLITNTKGLKHLSALDSGYSVTDALLAAAHVNSLHRASQLDEMVQAVDANGIPAVDGAGAPVKKPIAVMLMLGRRQRIAHGAAADASPGEEPVDLAVSVPPSLEVVGETGASQLELSVRIRFATRVKDKKGLVALYEKPSSV